MIKPKIHNKRAGFTMIELMMVMVIAAIFLGLAAPNFYSFIVSTRLTSQVNELVADVRLARSEAASRGVRVVICPSNDGGATCSSEATDWSKGRIVFVDGNANQSLDSGEAVLKKYTEALSGNTSVTTTGFSVVALTFNPYGGLLQGGSLGGSGTFTLCSSSSASGRSLRIDASGRAVAAKVACS